MRHVICFCTIIIFSICAHATHIDSRHKLRRRYANLLDDVDDFDNIVEPERYQKDIYGSISGKDDDVSQAIRKVDVLDLTGIDNDINIKRDVDSSDSFNDVDKSKKVQHRKIRTSSDLRKYENLLNLKYGGFKRFRRKRSKTKNKRKRYINILPPQLFDKRNSYIGYLAEATNDKLLKMQNYAATMMVILTTAKPHINRDQDEAALYQNMTQDAKLVHANNITEIMMRERSGRSNKGIQSVDPNRTLVGFDRSNPLQNISVFTPNYPVYTRQGPPINEANFQNASIVLPTFSNSSSAVNIRNASMQHEFIKTPDGAMSLNVNKVGSSAFDVPMITSNAADNAKQPMNNDVTLQGRDLNPVAYVSNLTSGNMQPNLKVSTNVVHMQPNNQMQNIPQQNSNQTLHNARGNVAIENNVQLKNYSQGLINVPTSQSYNSSGAPWTNAEKSQRYISINPVSDVNKIAGKIQVDEGHVTENAVAKSSTGSMVSLTDPAMLLNATPTLNSNAFNVNVMTNKNDIKTILLEPPPGIKFNTNYVNNAFSINSSSAADLYIDNKTQNIKSTNPYAPPPSQNSVNPYHPTSNYNRDQQMRADQSNVSHDAKFRDEDLYFMDNNGANRNLFASDDVDDDEDSMNKMTNIARQEEEAAQDEHSLMGDEWSMSNNYKMHQLTRADKNKRNNKAALYDNGRYKRESNAAGLNGADVAMNVNNGHQDFRRGGTQEGYGQYKKSIDTSNIANGTFTARIINPRLLMNDNEILNAINAVPFNFVENANMPQYVDSMNIRNVIPFQGGNISLLLNYNQSSLAMSSNLSTSITTPASSTTTTHPGKYSSRKATSISDNPYYWENNILRQAKIRIRKIRNNDSVPTSIEASNNSAPLANPPSNNSDIGKNSATKNPFEVVQNVSSDNELCQDILQEDVLNHGVNISITTITDEDDDFNRPKECMKNDMHCQADTVGDDVDGYDIVCGSTTPLPEYVNISSAAASKQGTSNSSDVKMNGPDNLTDEDMCLSEVGDYDEKENCEEGVPKSLEHMQLECADPRAKVKPAPPPSIDKNARRKKSVVRMKDVRTRRHVKNKAITEFPVTPEITTVACRNGTCLPITTQDNLDEEQFTTATLLSNPAAISSSKYDHTSETESGALCNSNSTCEIETDVTQQIEPSLAATSENVASSTMSLGLPKVVTVETEESTVMCESTCETESVVSYSEAFNSISSTNNNISSLLSIIVVTTPESTTSETITLKTNTQYVNSIPSELEETTNTDVGTTVWETITAIGTTTEKVVNAATTIELNTATFQAHEESTTLSPENGTICALQEVSGGKQLDFELQLVTPISTDGNNTQCPVKDYNASRSCVCSIDMLLKDLKQKTTQREFAESVEKYMCNSFVPINKGIKLGMQMASSQIQDTRRSKREVVETGETEVHKRDVIQNAEILHALENDFQIRNTDKQVYATPGGEVKINCAPPPLESTTGTWQFNGKSLTEGKVVEGNSFITVDTIVPQDGGNYTCIDVHGLRHVHKLSVISLPFFIVNASILYEVNDICEEKNADSFEKYLSTALSDMLCGSELKICNLMVHNTHCVHKGAKDYLDTSIELGMEPLETIMPNLNKTDCDVTCQLKLYSRMVGILVKNLDIFQIQTVYFNASVQDSMVLRPIEAESNADHEGTAASKLIVSCAPGFGLIPGSHICEACLPNTFSAGDEAFCIDCPPATYQPTAGCKSCLTCTTIFDDILCVRGIIFDSSHFTYMIALGGSILVLLTVGMGFSLAKKGGSKDPTECDQVHSRKRKKRRRTTTDAEDVEKQDDFSWRRNNRAGRSLKEDGSPIGLALLRS